MDCLTNQTENWPIDCIARNLVGSVDLRLSETLSFLQVFRRTHNQISASRIFNQSESVTFEHAQSP